MYILFLITINVFDSLLNLQIHKSIMPEHRYGDVVLKSPEEVVHLEYTPTRLAPKPSEEWTRFVCISDTHSRSFSVPEGDVLLHSGDLTNLGTVADFEKTMEWLYSLPHKIKIIIAGNHDLTLHADWYEQVYEGWHWRQGKQKLAPIMKLLKGTRATKAGIVYLQDEEFKFRVKENGKLWSVYGSPWSPEFFNWAFNYPREEGEELVSKFPKTDILLTHGPPFRILDRTGRGDDVGCEALRARLSELRPRLHLFGHIHEAHGAYIHAWDPASDNAPPTIQNSDPIDSTSRPAVGAELRSTENTEPAVDRTVFVNASSWPSGDRAIRDGVRVGQFGGPGFQAVVVDLKE
ncbi:Metallo-dependent phosphatase-like protein [Flammula alnicola]|nr:Metallo-dependent phosphatase-like protein [Flammula alnicola]